MKSEVEPASAPLVKLQAGALIVTPEPLFTARREQLVALASRLAVPAIYAWREFAVAGGLISYGPSLTAANRQAGISAERSSRAPSRAICRSSSRQHSNWSSISTR